MASKRVLTILSCCLFASCRAGKDTVDEVKQILNRANVEIFNRSLDFVPAPDYSFYLPVFGSVDVVYGSVGRLSTLVVRRETDQHLNRTRAGDGSTEVEFDVSVGLERIQLNYHFILRWLLLFKKTGAVSVQARTNTVNLKGTLRQSAGGNCSAVLTRAAFTELSDFSVTMDPKSIVTTTWGYLFDILYNTYLKANLFGVADSYLKLYITKSVFKDNFSEILCDSFV